MYKIIGADGKEYGPVSLDQLRGWASSGRVNAQTRVQVAGSSDWKPATEVPEINAILTDLRPASPPPSIAPSSPAPKPETGLAVTSLVLGIFSVICLGFLTGIPAIICGHKALNRSKVAPQQYGGGGLALAGLIMGYVSLALTVVFVGIYAAMLLPALSRAKSRAQEINCMNNLKQVGLAFRTWAIDHNDHFPFNVSTNQGGTLELCKRGPDGFDMNSAFHFLVMSNELSTPKVLVCPANNKMLSTWQEVQPGAVSYKVRSGENVSDGNHEEVLAICPIHNNVLRADGSVTREGASRR